MNDFTKRLLEDVEEFPVLFRNLGLLDSLLGEIKASAAGAPVPEEIAAKIAASEKLYAEGIQAFRSLHQQISQILGVAEGTVKSRLSRAREQLRKKMAANGNFSGASASNCQKGGRLDVQK